MYGGVRPVVVACTFAGLVLHCGSFSGTNVTAPADDGGTSDAAIGADAGGVDAATVPAFCSSNDYKLCLDFDDGILAKAPFTPTDVDGVLSIVPRAGGKALSVNAAASDNAGVGRVDELGTTVPMPSTLTFGFTLMLPTSDPQAAHVEIAGFEIQTASAPSVWAVIKGANLDFMDNFDNMEHVFFTTTLPAPGIPVSYEVAFGFGDPTTVTLTRDGKPVPVNTPLKLATFTPNSALPMQCAAGMHLRRTPDGATNFVLDNVYFTW